ncbi:DUF3231 family protein [Bacillus sp. Marseille-P3661]|uniref:DUF3231 family protein n=1 Tax=Bacillus sp. Marseille-P3661 TaxID=1936234 RepID=UPI002155B5F4|nr:DUF3231 family protein [Bacillus sp. Marseille-P3661]
MTNNTSPNLTSSEMGKLWAIYIGNTMSTCILSYYLRCVEDQDIKKVLENALQLSEKFVKSIKEMFIKEGFPIPAGFSEHDVNLNAPKLFSDEFYLHYLKYLGKAGMSIYSVAVPLVTREDVKKFFVDVVQATVQLLNDVNETLDQKGYLMKSPPIPIPEKVKFVQKQSYLNGFFGNVRPLHGLEIAHLHDNIENDSTSKALLIAFSQTAKDEKVKQYFIRGKELTHKHVEICSQHLHKENLPSHPLLDHLVSTSTEAPFSDKLMLYHKIDMFSMKIRSYANGMSLNGRRDISAMYIRFLTDVGLYLEDGMNIGIDHGWMEQPPEAADRDRLTSK